MSNFSPFQMKPLVIFITDMLRNSNLKTTLQYSVGNFSGKVKTHILLVSATILKQFNQSQLLY